ncbi:MAG: S8 family serine peptidase [Crocinitomicaceae bacterium]|nr:S8 family serine peptidase [Crocinitomicaceae bacterium]
MKTLVSFILFSIIFVSATISFSQTEKTHFDNKSYREGEFLIQLTSEDALKDILQAAPSNFKLEVIKYVSQPMRVWLVKFDHTALSHQAMQSWFYHQKSVSVADYNYYIQMRETTPGDPSFTQQWHHVNTGQNGGTPDADIDSDLAWDITKGGKTATNDDIVVCMVENTGGNLDHQDLSPNRWTNPYEIPGNGIDDDGNGYIDDYNGWNTQNNNDNTGTGAHGTNCLGMIGAKGDNGLNVVGANWDVKLMVVNMSGSLDQASVIQAYTYPLVMRKLWNQSGGTQGAFVVATSASWGIDNGNPANYPLWCQFYDTLGYHGILNIGATTNSNLNVDTAGDVPTACSSDYMIGVGRTDNKDNTAGGYGVTTIPLGAPGINVVTTAGTNGITTTTGTSFACPLTAGVVGLAYAIPCTSFMDIVKSNPRQGADLVRQALLTGVDVKTQLQSKFSTGGRLNARNTLDILMANTCSSCYVQDIQSTTNNTTATISFTPSTEVTSTTIKWREVGASTWNTENNATSPFQLTGLNECSNYQYYVISSCTSELDSSAYNTFSTSGCGNCVDLAYCDSKAVNTNTRLSIFSPATVATTITNYTKTDNWGANIDANYVYGDFVLMQGNSNNEGCGTISNGADLNGKIAVAVRGTCNFSEKAVNAQNAGAIGLIIINNQTSAPTTLGSGTGAASVTIPVVMITQTQGVNLITALTNNETVSGLLGKQQEWIQSFEVNNTITTSGNNNGYLSADATNSLILEQGATYPFTLTPGFSAQNLPEQTRIWIDNNQNGTFESSELIYDQGTSSFGTLNDALEIPLTATVGSTRMRVQMAFIGTDQTTAPAICGDFGWGEVEDYCLTIVEANTSGLETINTNQLKVYPNPASEIVTFMWNHSIANATIQIVDLVGKPIYSAGFNSSTHSIDVSGYSTGTYLYQINGEFGNTLAIGKIIVE